MFRLLKEALAVPERPATGPFPSQRVPAAGPSSSTGRHGKTAVDPSLQPSQDASAMSDEDMLFQETLEELSRRKLDSKEELEMTVQTLNKVSSLLSSVPPARVQLFRTGDGFSTVKGILDDLFRESSHHDALDEPFESRGHNGFGSSEFDPVKGKETLQGRSTGSSSFNGRGAPEAKDVTADGIPKEDQISVFRLALEVTVLALRDERNRRWFEEHLGWQAYSKAFQKAICCKESLSEGYKQLPEQALPDHQILGILLSQALSKDQSLLGLFDSATLQSIQPYPSPLPISSHLTVSDPQLLACVLDILPLPYICSKRSKFDEPIKKIATWPRSQGGDNLSLPDHLVVFEQTLWRLFLVIIQSNWMNLFEVTKNMGAGGLVECVLDRLYPPRSHLIASKLEARRSSLSKRVRWSYDAAQDPFAAGAASRSGAAVDKRQTSFLPAADGVLRKILFKVLRRLLEAGVHPRLSFRLFKQLRRENNISLALPIRRRPGKSGQDSSGNSTPSVSGQSPSGHARTRSRKLDQPVLQLNLNDLSIEGEIAGQLDDEMLEAVSHGMGKRWPDLFGFKGDGGRLALTGLQQWPIRESGFYFMAWIYIEQLCAPVVLLHASEGSKTVLRIRILLDSQVAVLAVDRTEKHAQGTEPHEVVFSGSDNMVPHQGWVHIAIGGRVPPSTATNGSGPEVKLVINGKRCGRPLKCDYPSPSKGASMECFIGQERDPQEPILAGDAIYRGLEGSLWYLGQSTLFREYIGDDLGLLFHHLGPRYQGNFQEPLGRFLTYEGATSLNIYLSQLAKVTRQGVRTTLPSNSYLIRGIKQGRVISENTILFSLGAQNVVRSSHRKLESSEATKYQVMNAAAPTVAKGLASASGRANVSDGVFWMRGSSLDQAFNIAGGPSAALHLVELANSSNRLQLAISILFNTVKEDWAASEEIERMHGYDCLAGLLRNKMQDHVTLPVLRTIFLSIGIDFDKPETATILNSGAYRALALRLDLWSRASTDVVELFCRQFQHLLVDSKFKRYNILKCFRKIGITRMLMYALKANTFDSAAVPRIVDAAKTIFAVHWSSDDSIKPLFAYLISTLCPAGQTTPLDFGITLPDQPTQSQAPAAMLLEAVSELCHDDARSNKLQSSLPVHRVLVILLSNNPAKYVVRPCLDMITTMLCSASGESFRGKFDGEGGFALLDSVLPGLWNEQIQIRVIECVRFRQGDKRPNGRLFPCAIYALSRLLNDSFDNIGQRSGKRPRSARTETSDGLAVAFGSSPCLPALTSIDTSDAKPRKELNKLLQDIASLLQSDPDLFTNPLLEDLIPSVAEFISLSATLEDGTGSALEQRKDVLDNLAWALSLMQNLSDLPPVLQEQMEALREQVKATSGTEMLSSSLLSSSAASIKSSKSFLSSNSSNRLPPKRLTRRPTTGEKKRSYISRKIPLIRRLTGDARPSESKDKNNVWKLSIIAAESTKYAKTTLDNKEYWRRIENDDWPKQRAISTSDGGLWPEPSENVQWRLDGSEGPLRKRMKLERVVQQRTEKVNAPPTRSFRTAVPREDELSSAASHMGQPQGDDPFAAQMGEATRRPSIDGERMDSVLHTAPLAIESVDDELADETGGDSKQRRIENALQSGDTIEDCFNISRAIGVDGAPGLLILGRKCMYVLDGLVRLDTGEVVGSEEAPRDMFSIPSGKIAEAQTNEMETSRWTYAEVVESNKRSFLFRDVAIEFFFADKRNFLVVFRNKKERQAALHRLGSKNDPNTMKQSAIGNLILDTVAKAIDRASLELDGYTRQWQNRQLSNFAYLQILNQYANRTPNDVTQYPVFPWILKDYSSEILNLSNPNSFRDLSLPMGALTEARRQAATERYQQSGMVGDKPFHFGTHYSSSMITCSFLIRLEPFTEMFLTLQGGNFDLADRLFSSIPKAWSSASEENRGDVRELIPEFFYSPLFLDNINRLDMGRKQISNEEVDSVDLPGWALDDPLLFIHRHREALESDYVSRHLPSWIDLTFGCKQHDEASYTCFHPLSYKDAVDLDAISDEGERAASVGIIHNFGQTPHQIFALGHPHRFLNGVSSSLPIGQRFGVDEHFAVLIRSALPVADSSAPGYDICHAPTPEVPPVMAPHGRVFHPDIPACSLRYGFSDQSIRGYFGMTRVMCVAEQSPAVEAVFVSATRFVTASPEGVLKVWRIKGGSAVSVWTDTSRMMPIAILRGHEDVVNRLTASSAWSVLISSSDDGSAIVWDTNRFKFVRRLVVEPSEPIRFAAVDDATGHIALLCDSYIHLFTLNGAHIASASTPMAPIQNYSMSGNATTPQTDFNGGISFYEQEFSKHGPLFAVGYGNSVALWRLVPGVVGEPPWSLHEVKRLNGPNDDIGPVTAVNFMRDNLYACFAQSKTDAKSKATMYQWSLPEGGARNVSDTAVTTCMAGCGRSFGLLEPRRYCGGCGGCFCSADAVHITGFNLRYCPGCRVVLALAVDVIGGPGSRRGSVAASSSRRSSVQPLGLYSRRGSLIG